VIIDGTIPAGPFELAYRIEGQGYSAIVPGSVLYYSRVFSQALRERLRMIFLDHRGFARQSGAVDPQDYAFPVVIEDIERARQRLGLDRVAAIGHSGHAYMALEYAKKFADHVSHVIMIGIAPDLSVASATAAEAYWQDSLRPSAKRVWTNDGDRCRIRSWRGSRRARGSFRRAPRLIARLQPRKRWRLFRPKRMMKAKPKDQVATRHVYCATEVHSSRHAYFSHDLLYVPFAGVASPVGLKLSTVVQASANFPGGFGMRFLASRTLGQPRMIAARRMSGCSCRRSPLREWWTICLT
jgi:pimeloyl-ACP methyl ester carboxylesterase